MKLISWNVNGLRACIGKGFLDFVNFIDADVICLQETKLQPVDVLAKVIGDGKRLLLGEHRRAGVALFVRAV